MAKPVILQLTTMVILMVIGIILNKKKFLSIPNAKGLSIILARVAVPCNLIILMQREYSDKVFYDFLSTFAMAFIMMSIGAVIFFIVGKFLKLNIRELGLFSGGGVYKNTIFMGQPLIMAMYGSEGLIFCVAIMVTMNVFLFTVCSVLFTMGGEGNRTFLVMMKDAFINVVCFAAVIGIVCFVNSIVLPVPVSDALQYGANTTVCLSMIYIGTLLAESNIKGVFKNKVFYIFTFFTLVIIPIITRIVGGMLLSGLALNVLVILMATPAAAALPSFAEVYGNDEKRASEYTFVSTIFSVITLPLVAAFLCNA